MVRGILTRSPPWRVGHSDPDPAAESRSGASSDGRPYPVPCAPGLAGLADPRRSTGPAPAARGSWRAARPSGPARSSVGRDLPRQPGRLRFGQLLLERRDLLGVRRVGEDLGLQLPPQPAFSRRSPACRLLLGLPNRLDRRLLVLRQVRAPQKRDVAAPPPGPPQGRCPRDRAPGGCAPEKVYAARPSTPVITTLKANRFISSLPCAAIWFFERRTDGRGMASP